MNNEPTDRIATEIVPMNTVFARSLAARTLLCDECKCVVLSQHVGQESPSIFCDYPQKHVVTWS
jgi:hypothetical protein